MNPRVECIIPILRVANLAMSKKFYLQTLGFNLDWGAAATDKMCQVSRDGQAIMLCQGEQGNPGTWIWIGVEDIKPLYERLQRDAVQIILPSTNFSWAYEFRIADPDGHVLRFGSDPLANVPFQDQNV